MLVLGGLDVVLPGISSALFQFDETHEGCPRHAAGASRGNARVAASV